MTKSQKKIIDIKAHRAMIKHMYETNHPGVKLPLWVYLHDTAITVSRGILKKSKILPPYAEGYMDGVFGELIISNLLVIIGDHTENPKIQTLGKNAQIAAYQALMDKLKVQQLVNKLLKNPDISNMLENIKN